MWPAPEVAIRHVRERGSGPPPLRASRDVAPPRWGCFGSFEPVNRVKSTHIAFMDVFHFGPDGGLLGSYTPPSAGKAGGVAVLCYPFGQEYMRAHRAFRQVALLLERRGVGVLRFDYWGTGDSSGDGEEARLTRWVEDVRAAIQEARRRSGLDRVRLGGLRLGSALAALAAEGRDEVERLVLWDPVVRGGRFVDELDRDASPRIGSTWWVHGFPVPQGLRQGLGEIDLRDASLPEGTAIVQMISHSNPEFTALGEALKGHTGSMETRLVPSPSDWNYSDDVGGILMPREMVRGVVDALAG